MNIYYSHDLGLYYTLEMRLLDVQHVKVVFNLIYLSEALPFSTCVTVGMLFHEPFGSESPPKKLGRRSSSFKSLRED